MIECRHNDILAPFTVEIVLLSSVNAFFLRLKSDQLLLGSLLTKVEIVVIDLHGLFS